MDSVINLIGGGFWTTGGTCNFSDLDIVARVIYFIYVITEPEYQTFWPYLLHSRHPRTSPHRYKKSTYPSLPALALLNVPPSAGGGATTWRSRVSSTSIRQSMSPLLPLSPSQEGPYDHFLQREWRGHNWRDDGGRGQNRNSHKISIGAAALGQMCTQRASATPSPDEAHDMLHMNCDAGEEAGRSAVQRERGRDAFKPRSVAQR